MLFVIQHDVDFDRLAKAIWYDLILSTQKMKTWQAFDIQKQQSHTKAHKDAEWQLNIKSDWYLSQSYKIIF